MQAHDMVRRRNWSRAIALYDQILAQLSVATAALTKSQKDRQIACLLGRCECLLELAKYENCLTDARRVLTLLAADQNDCIASVSRTRRWLIHSLCKLKKFTEAEQIAKEWISEISGQPSFADISKTIERYRTIIQMVSGQKTNQKVPSSRLDDEMSMLDTKLDHWATNNLPLDKFSKLLSNKGLKKRENTGHNGVVNNSSSSCSSNSSNNTSVSLNTTTAIIQKTSEMLDNFKIENSDGTISCSYCAISCASKNELRQHCQTENHQNVIMSDQGRDWKWRPPPRGFTLDTYILCESFSESQSCHYGNQCVEAHGLEELNEWKERFEYRRMRLQRACEKELYGKSYTEEILEKWIQATSPDRIMREKTDDVEDVCNNELVTSISSKSSKREWIFILKSAKPLKAVALLQDAHRNHFAIKSIFSGDKKPFELKSDQEWVATTLIDRNITNSVEFSHRYEQKVTIEFNTDIYGTFRQSVCFDFGSEPLLVKHLCVDVVPVGDAEKIEEIKKDIINSSSARWDDSNANLVKFETTIGTHLKTEAFLSDLKHEKEMLERYPCPRAATFTLTQSTIVERRLTQNNYSSRIHELLYVEEIARYEQIARYNLTTKLKITSNYILTPAGMATSTAKYSLSGELFALMTLGKDISEDTSAGRLILSNCSSVHISALQNNETKDVNKKRDVFEAVIEDKGKNIIYLKLSAKCVESMSLKADTDAEVDIQFQLNRLPYCEWHNAVDKITDFKIIFPDTEIEPNIPWTPKKQWSETSDLRLNAKQREAVNAITTQLGVKLPPILLIGPFGTGKTYTLAQAIKQLLTQPEAKILICTHSNSAADLYIKEYLHPWIESGMEEAKPLRVYYHKRWVATVNSVVQKYCITDGAGNFRRPTVEDIMKHRIVVVTLSISMELSTLGLPKGYFTHIFLDEAAQAMECEAIMPLALANEGTRIVLAGDHMQMSPELFSNFAKERKLHISLLERLYDHYPSNFPCKILLCENYRAHEAIIKFTSELFYEQKLIASGKQPRHDRFYPLTFFTTRGEDVQDKNSTAFYNNSEVYEVVERVCELRKKWPSSWGKMNDASIGIMTPYADQVFRIRSELRKRRMGGISVERVLNVQGKQFRAIFLSTVRTRRTCLPNNNSSTSASDDADYGFLSNSKLLNTAITRAQSLVAVVGDPVALCSIGRCRKVWERFIEICNENKSLFGITWSYLRSQLDGVELKRSYVLNPLAPEFIPRALQPEAYLRDQTAMYLLGSTNQHNLTGGHHQSNNQVPSMYGNLGGPYAMLNQSQMAQVAKSAHHNQFHHGNIPMRPIGPPQHNPNFGMQAPNRPPAHIQQSQQQFPPYMIWPQQQAPPPPQQQSNANIPNQMMRPSYPGQQPPIQPPQTQNPNASLWGPPPQNNPWGVIPKSGVPNPNHRPPNQMPNTVLPQQNASHNITMSSAPRTQAGIPSLPQHQLQNTGPLTVQNQSQNQVRGQTVDMSFLKKSLYQHPNPSPNIGYNNQLNQPVMLNNRLNNSYSNGPISPATGAPGQGPGIEPFVRQAPNVGLNLHHQNNLIAAANNGGGHKEKDFQFLNNVHIPVNIGGSLFQAPPTAAAVQNPATHMPTFQEYSSLLPPNMTIYEMAFEPKESQYKWYLKLLEIHGQESANKFTEILRQAMGIMHSSKPNSVPPLQTNQQHQIPMQMSQNQQHQHHHQQQQQQQPQQHQHTVSITRSSSGFVGPPTNPLASTRCGTPPSSAEPSMNFNQQIDMVFNSLMNGNEISQPILREILGMVGSAGGVNNGSNSSIQAPSGNVNQLNIQPGLNMIGKEFPLSQQQKTAPSPLFPNQQNVMAGNNDFLLGNELPGTSTPRVESVPLYRRQVINNGNSSYHGSNSSSSTAHSIASSTPDNLLDSGIGSSNQIHSSGNLIDTIFNISSNSDLSATYQNSSFQKLFYNNFPLKLNDLDMRNERAITQQQRQHHIPVVHNQQQHQQQQVQMQLHNHGEPRNTTYAAVLSQGNVVPNSQLHQLHHSSQGHVVSDEKDPFAAIRELGQGTNGFYNYFQ